MAEHLDDKELLLQFKDPGGLFKGSWLYSHHKKYREKLYWHIRRMVVSMKMPTTCCRICSLKGLEKPGEFSGRQPVVYLALPDRYQREPHFSAAAEEKEFNFYWWRRKSAYQQDQERWPFWCQQTGMETSVGHPETAWKTTAVFNLRYYEEMPYEEMSRVLETSEGALKTSYHHAVKKLKNIFWMVKPWEQNKVL